MRYNSFPKFYGYEYLFLVFLLLWAAVSHSKVEYDREKESYRTQSINQSINTFFAFGSMGLNFQQHAATGKVDVLRAGIWKPRTRPDNFEGVGFSVKGMYDESNLRTLLLTGKGILRSIQ